MFAPVTKWSALMATPGAAPEMIRKALQARADRTARPPSTWPSAEDTGGGGSPSLAPLSESCPADDPSAEQVSRAAQILREATPTRSWLAGHGAPGPGPVRTDPLRARRSTFRATTFTARPCFPRRPPASARHGRFMRHDTSNFGFDRATSSWRRPTNCRSQPGPDQPQRAPRSSTCTGSRRGRRHYDVAVGLKRRHQPQPRRARGGRVAQSRSSGRRERSGSYWRPNCPRPRRTPVSPAPGAHRGRHAARSAARTSALVDTGALKMWMPGCTRPTRPTPA